MRWTPAASIATYSWPDGSGGAADPRPGDRRLRSVAMSREECREPVAGVPEGRQCGERRRAGRTPGACRGENAGGSGTIISNASCPTGIIRNRCASSICTAAPAVPPAAAKSAAPKKTVATTPPAAAVPSAKPVQPPVVRVYTPRERLILLRSSCGGDVRCFLPAHSVGRRPRHRLS